MKIKLAYGKETLEISMAAPHLLDVLTPGSESRTASTAEILHRALAKPIAADPFEAIFLPRNKVTLVLPDKTRKSGSPQFLPLLLEKLHQQGIADSDILVLLANGSHGRHSKEEVARIVGADLIPRLQIVEHTSQNENELAFLGRTSAGTPVTVNRHVLECDRLLVAGTAVHHYFAGFGGGPKMIVPGCAGYETITRNHALAIDADRATLHPACRPGTIENNPIQDDIREAMQWVRVDFLLETVLDETGGIAAAFAGELQATHEKACQFVNQKFCVPILEKADLVLASCGGFPKDINLIQTHKSLFNAFQAVKPGGVLFLLAECSQGIGSDTFLDWFSFSEPSALRRALAEHFTLNATTALSLQEKTKTVHVVLLSGLDADLVQHLGMHRVATVAEGMQTATRFLPQSFKAFVLPNASLTLPVMEV